MIIQKIKGTEDINENKPLKRFYKLIMNSIFGKFGVDVGK